MRLKLPNWLANRLVFRKEPKIVMSCRVYRAKNEHRDRDYWEDGPEIKASRRPVEVIMGSGMQ